MRFPKIPRWLRLLLLPLVAVAVFSCRPSYLWLKAWYGDHPIAHEVPSGFTDDASRLNRTQVAEVWSIPGEAAAAEHQLRELLRRARTEHLRISIAGARHSMGGHTIAAEGIVLNMLPFQRMELNAARGILRVGAGARWSEIIPYLDARGFSVAIMQSNNNFTVGGSLSVNCHGWTHNCPPIASTVESLRIMNADGILVRCSREENAELFSLVLGGYGLFGIILDAEIRVVPNMRYRPEIEIVASENYAARFTELTRDATDLGMVYGRLCVVPGKDTFLRQVVLTAFRQSSCKKEEIPSLRSPGYTTLRRAIHRAQIDSDSGKEVRWQAEKTLSKLLAKEYFSRNQLLNEAVEVYQERNADRTDILHEYFVPPQRVAAFLERARTIVPKHHGDLLNVTLRNIREDKDTFLRYADREMFGLVMLFNQLRTPEADEQMQAMTRELIAAALECEGRYYLPYRLHATKTQFYRAYPQAAAFFEKKRRYDPDEIFQNRFYIQYGRP